MAQDTTSVRINFSVREIEVTGTEQNVRGWMETLEPYLKEFAGDTPVEPSAGSRDTVQRHAAVIPEVFGEYYQQFPDTVTETDRVLIAGYFAQQDSANNQFTTGDARRLLEEQAVRVANPSECIRRHRDARRLFSVGNGAYRVSHIGVAYLNGLRA